ncbi:hypothetical protein DAI22_10g079601 [Oryza sativa Japonica Group]|nr:hypothetical protein DAI22_10g079601 [Oryza sativa Japonica Group]
MCIISSVTGFSTASFLVRFIVVHGALHHDCSLKISLMSSLQRLACNRTQGAMCNLAEPPAVSSRENNQYWFYRANLQP